MKSSLQTILDKATFHGENIEPYPKNPKPNEMQYSGTKTVIANKDELTQAIRKDIQGIVLKEEQLIHISDDFETKATKEQINLHVANILEAIDKYCGGSE